MADWVIGYTPNNYESIWDFSKDDGLRLIFTSTAGGGAALSPSWVTDETIDLEDYDTLKVSFDVISTGTGVWVYLQTDETKDSNYQNYEMSSSGNYGSVEDPQELSIDISSSTASHYIQFMIRTMGTDHGAVANEVWLEDSEGNKTFLYGEASDAPEIWRIPTDDDWKELEMYLGMSEEDANSTGFRTSGNVGSQLSDYTENGDNSSGFTALFGGYRSDSGTFFSLESAAVFWTASPDSNNAFYRYLDSTSSGVSRLSLSRTFGFSVRCFRVVVGLEESDPDGTVYEDDYEGNDGKKYDSVKIGEQVWIVENLKETKYEDGTDIPRKTENSDWSATWPTDDTDDARCEYNNNTNDESETYGFLYNWIAVNSWRGIANTIQGERKPNLGREYPLPPFGHFKGEEGIQRPGDPDPF